MQAPGATRRTGGRSARIQCAVHCAVTELLADPAAEVTVAAVAARSGVHPTSIYRRWGTLEALVLAVAVARLGAASPMPDTGRLREDLLSYARQAAHDLGQPDGLAFLRVVISTSVISTSGVSAAAAPRSGPSSQGALLGARGAQIQVMLDRAADRGESSLHYTDVLDVLLAPLYLRALFHLDGIDDAYLNHLVDRLLATPRAPDGPQSPRPCTDQPA